MPRWSGGQGSHGAVKVPGVAEMGTLGAAMRQHAVLQVLVTLGIGVGCATAALWAGLPAAALIGSALAVSTDSFFRSPPAD